MGTYLGQNRAQVKEELGMSYGRSRLYEHGDVAEQGDVAAAPVSPRSNPSSPPVRTARDTRREIDTLRSINAHLVRQIAVLKEREAQAQRLADRDGLTGLYNRRRMIELLEMSMHDAVQHKQRVGLLFVDLDGFKGVNDAHGHAAGDKLLMTVGARIAARARTGDFVCRYGGDEFVVILPRLADIAAARQVADSIGKRVALPYRMDGVELQLTAAIGVSIYPDEARSAADLMRLADESMYRVKSRWTHPAEILQRVSQPARRRDDKSKKRPGV
jgi:diguanylate cyclase (GGDEF)-like protein